jgi:5-formyltetrahydrofolate cyclo-ligase
VTAAAKKEMRRAALAKRTDVQMTRGPEASFSLPWHVLSAVPAGKLVAGYWAIGSELDLGPTLAALHKRGNPLALPVTGARGTPLVFRVWQPGHPLEKGPMGTSHPTASAPEAAPEVVLVPLLAFDARGNRLGYGAGFYDRTFQQMRAKGPFEAWGVAFDEQEEPAVPYEHTDEYLNGIITDRRVIRRKDA